MSLMAIFITIFEVLLGVWVMYLGVRMLVEAALWLAKVTGISALSLGAAVTGAVTVLLELFIGVIAVTHGLSGLLLTHIIALLIFNLGVISGVNIILQPGSRVYRKSFLWRGAILGLILLFVWWRSMDGWIDLGEAGVLLLMMVGVLIFSWSEIFVFVQKKLLVGDLSEAFFGKKSTQKNSKFPDRTHNGVEEKLVKQRSWFRTQWSFWLGLEGNRLKEKGRGEFLLNLARFLISLTLILVAAGYFMRNGLKVAVELNWSTQLAAATILVWGMAVPEMWTGLVATQKKKQSLSWGSLLGADMMCLTLVLGGMAWLGAQSFLPVWQKTLSTLNGGQFFANNWKIFGEEVIVPGKMAVYQQVTMVDIPLVLIMLLILMLPVALKGKFYRVQGLVLVLLYVGYLSWLIWF